jgi:hypothetical protein
MVPDERSITKGADSRRGRYQDNSMPGYSGDSVPVHYVDVREVKSRRASSRCPPPTPLFLALVRVLGPFGWHTVWSVESMGTRPLRDQVLR